MKKTKKRLPLIIFSALFALAIVIANFFKNEVQNTHHQEITLNFHY